VRNSTRKSDRQLALGNEAVDAGDHEAAIKHFLKAIALGNAGAGLNLGNSFLDLGDSHRAIEAYRAAWLAGDRDAAYNLATTLEDDGRTDEAAVLYGLLYEAGYSKSANAYAWILKDRHSDTAAEEVLASVIGQPGLIGRLASGTLGHWRWTAGVLDVEPLLRKGADSFPAARADLAALLLHRGDRSEAQKILEVGALNGEVASMVPLGNLLWEDGQVVAAERHLSRAAALGDSFGACNYAQLLVELGRRSEARVMFMTASELGDGDAARKLVELESG
jgi:TPR repeat protein